MTVCKVEPVARARRADGLCGARGVRRRPVRGAMTQGPATRWRLMIWLAGLLALLLPLAAVADGPAAQAPDAADFQRSLQLREQWQGLTRDVTWPAQWRSDGRFHYRKTVAGGFAFVVVDPQTLAREPAFDHAALAAALAAAGAGQFDALQLPFESFQWLAEGPAIRFRFQETPWQCTLAPMACERATPRGRPRGFGVVRDLEAVVDEVVRRSPDGRFEARVADHQLEVIRIADGETVLRSEDGGPAQFYDAESIQWSPDSRRLAVYRVQPGQARTVWRVESAPPDQVQPRLHRQLYPKPGDRVDIERPVLADVQSGRLQLIDNSLFDQPYQLSPLHWRADGRSVAFQYIRRGHQQVRLIEIAADTGTPRRVIDETSDTFVDTWQLFRHELGEGGERQLWLSERDGWRHLYRFDREHDFEPVQLTRGEWPVREVLHVDEDNGRIWFTASGMDAGRDPYFRHLFHVGIDGGEPVRVSHADADHQAAVSADGRWVVTVHSRVDLAPVMQLHRADGEQVAVIERGDIERLLAAGWQPPQVFFAKGRDGSTDIRGLVVRPRDFDPARRYPVIENIYAGPHDAFVPTTFWPFGFHSGGDKVIGMQAQADLGFIVVQIDGMGTAHRGKAFHDVAWQNLADSGFPDRIAWHRALAAREPAYDLSRVGIYGASAGGQSALNALLFHPDFYHVAVAYNGCYDNRMDKISWNEQWLGWPVGEAYLAASGVEHAHRLRGELLLIVGEQDANVDPASTMQVVNALIGAGKDFDLLHIPGGDHAVGRSSGPIDYVQRRQFDFFVRHLLGAPTPRWNRVP